MGRKTTIIDLLSQESHGEGSKIFLAATGAGVANALVLMLVSSLAPSPDSIGLHSFFLFAIAVVLYVVSARYTFHRTTSIVEDALHHLKRRVVEKIERAELAGLERVGAAEIYDRLTENATIISGAAGLVANVMQQLLIFLFAVLYLAWLSPPAFLIVALLLAAGLSLYWTRNEGMAGLLAELAKTRLAFFDALTDLLKGFKEVKFSRARSAEVREDILRTSASLRDVSKKANALFDDNFILASCNLFVLLGALVFVLPQHVHVEGALLSKLVAGTTFMWGPLQGVVSGYPAYLRSNQAIAEIQALEDKLDAAARAGAAPTEGEDPWNRSPGAIEAQNIEYEYAPTNGGGAFHIGPIDLSIAPGEIVFIVGGNGSGKSTFMKVLTGLYPPTVGAMRAGGTPVHPENAWAYREMISAIFSDFHLFSKAYGLTGIEGAAVQRLLVQMQLDTKTSFEGGRFTQRDLSTGQRKRLAMIVALLEDRPIYIFDEWAADQDPEFRKYFYENLLPSLKQRGKTVIAVSHDDRYFHCADRVITMDYGTVRSIEPGSTWNAGAHASELEGASARSAPEHAPPHSLDT